MSTQRPLPRWKRGVREAIYDHVYSSPAGEVGGVLVGDIPQTGPVRISGAIAALRAEGERASVTFTHDAWAEVHSALETKHKGKRIVGWYHSHPGFGIFLSAHDLFIQRNFFSDPAQVAYVVDPHASTEGLFGWVDGEIAKVASADTPRAPVAIVPGAMAPRLVRQPARSLWVTALWGFVAGIVVGGVLWFAALRPSTDVPVPAAGSAPAATSTSDALPATTSGVDDGVLTEAPATRPDTETPQATPPPESSPSEAGSGKPTLKPRPTAPSPSVTPAAGAQRPSNGSQPPPPSGGNR